MAGRIEDYALLGDLGTAALVGADGSVDWLCLPRFDSPSCFAALLGEERHGHWALAPADADGTRPVSRRYLGDTLVLETRWRTATGEARVLDFMPQRPADRAGEPPRLVRLVEGLAGSVAMRGRLRVRFHYGRVVPWVRRTGHHRVAVAGPDAAWLSVPPGVHTYGAGEGADGCTRSDFTVTEGERVAFTLTWQPSHLTTARRFDPERSLRETLDGWENWSALCRYQGPWRAPVLRSLLTLKALSYAPTGGIVAAPTTSLPEWLGGPRNWDYRYCWLRDASLTLAALLRTGYREEAVSWRRWLLRAIAGERSGLQALYGVAGERAMPETVADWLPGYDGSRPVRIGNAAAGQMQLDVRGEVADMLHRALDAGIPMERQVWSLFRSLMATVAARWREPDEGLWEMRGGRRHFTHSKVMCWVAADRAVRMAERTGLPAPLAEWRALRDAVHADVCAHGYDPARGVFVQAYGDTGLDAATLLLAQCGFLPADDPRVVRTVDAVRDGLDLDGFVRRYDPGTTGDGLSGGEGAFLACSFWLAEALALGGRHEEAVEFFDRTVAVGGELGLLSEQWDPFARRQLGNAPQAFTHVALVNAAFALDGVDSLG
ncbi:glycoside hydrolase family 15 protein [Streptacidiphilus pinicola]|uniref:Glycoside hydrolase family 15 protein n=1 Tax=Streptacidiphilus pinicola TaxID=2219663 RepID=A0A2X0IAR2_9ACTN|nr:glycoside hydrolase family 15 protein [Streptacidiphilus pinicola]RAG81607.1 glycoside hydrolase family 15 protein [Streptacidiphilus pinicola]